MSRGHAVRKSDLDRVLKALRDAGQSVRQIEMRPDGGVLIVPAAGAHHQYPRTGSCRLDQVLQHDANLWLALNRNALHDHRHQRLFI